MVAHEDVFVHMRTTPPSLELITPPQISLIEDISTTVPRLIPNLPPKPPTDNDPGTGVVEMPMVPSPRLPRPKGCGWRTALVEEEDKEPADEVPKGSSSDDAIRRRKASCAS